MPNTYTQIHIQSVIVVQNRDCVISNSWKDQLYKYIATIIQNNGHKVIIINGMPDHVHLLFGLRPHQSLSALMQQIKQDTSKWINKNRTPFNKFSWQKGYASFSYSKSQLPRVINYIKNQEQHHHKRSFFDEYLALLKVHGIDYNEKYLFKKVL